MVGQPSGDWRADRGGNDITGQHPTDGFIGSAQRGLHMGQSDIGDTNLAVLHGAIGLGVLNVVLALVLYRLLRSGWKLKS